MLGLVPIGTPLSALASNVYDVGFFSNGYGGNAYGAANYGIRSSDVFDRSVGISRSVSETATSADSLSINLSAVGNYIEVITSSDSIENNADLYINVIELGLLATDYIDPINSIYFIGLSESAYSNDLFAAKLLWEREEDTPETWDPESDTSAIWTNSSDNSYNWTNINDTPDTWTPVTDGSTTWTPI